MNAPFTQGSRAGRLSTVLGADALVLLRFAGSDRLSGLFGYEVDCLSTTPDIDFDAVVGTHATVTLVTHRGEDRPFDGIVAEARWLGAGENGHRYRLTLKPWFWLATRRRNQRIFHDKTVVEILQELLSAYAGAGPLEVATTSDYPKLCQPGDAVRADTFPLLQNIVVQFAIALNLATGSQGTVQHPGLTLVFRRATAQRGWQPCRELARLDAQAPAHGPDGKQPSIPGDERRCHWA